MVNRTIRHGARYLVSRQDSTYGCLLKLKRLPKFNLTLNLGSCLRNISYDLAYIQVNMGLKINYKPCDSGNSHGFLFDFNLALSVRNIVD